MPAERIQPAEALKKMTDEGFTYVDVRTEEEFAAGHPGGAFNVPVSLPSAGGLAPNPDFVSVMEKAFGKEAPLVLGCKTGARSARAGQMLLDAGFTKVLDQTAGWDGKEGAPGWSTSGLPTETGIPVDRSYTTAK